MGSLEDTDLVTIVITTKDRNELLALSVDSALAQSYPHLEVLIVDDASAVPVSHSWPDGRVRVIRRKESKGVCAARNTGLHEARGNWITFLDDDDILDPIMVEALLGAIRTSALPPPVAALGGIARISETGEVMSVSLPVTLPRGSDYSLETVDHGSFQTQNTLLIGTSTLRHIGGWNEEIRAAVHLDLLLRVNRNCSLQGVDTVVYQMISHPGTRVSRNHLARADGMSKALELHQDACQRHPRRHAMFLVWISNEYRRAGHRRRALLAAFHAVTIDPGRLITWKQIVRSVL